MPSHLSRLLVSFSLLVISFLAPQLWGAESLTGTVVDPSGASVPRATVRLRDATGAIVASTLTDTAGQFCFEGLPGTNYTLEVELTGFARARQVVVAGQQVKIELALAPVRERLVVTATRTEAPSGQLGSSVSVISADEIQNRHSVTLTELLRGVPGLLPTQLGAPGALTTLFVRGAESDHNRVFIDGVPVNEPGGLFNFANLTPLNLNRIEVVRGPQSALYGSDALGSVVQLFTRRGQAETRRPHAAFALEGGKHATLHATASLSGEVGAVDYSAGVARFLTDNEFSNSAFRNTSVSANFGLRPSQRASLRLILHGDFGTAGTPNQVAFRPPDAGEFFRRREGVTSVVFRHEVSARWGQRLAYGYTRSRQRTRDLVVDPPFIPQFEDRVAPVPFYDFLGDFLNDTRRHRLNYQSDYAFSPTQIFTVAFECERERGRLGDVFYPPFVVAHRTNLGYVFQHQALLFGRLYLTGGVRVEDNGSFGTEATPRLSVAYFLRRVGERLGATKLKFNFGTGIKEPQFVESFSPSPFYRGNPELQPERVRSFELGVAQRFWHDRGKLEINWFDNRFRDLIAFQIVDFLTFAGSFFNLARTKAKGAEVVLELVPGRGLRGTASYTFLDSLVTQGVAFDPVFVSGQRLFRRPKHAGSLTLLWDWRRFNLTTSAVFVGSRVDSDFLLLGLTRNRGYSKWDFAASYRPRRVGGERVTYYVLVENLLNRHYMEVLGFPALKLNVRAGVRLEF